MVVYVSACLCVCEYTNTMEIVVGGFLESLFLFNSITFDTTEAGNNLLSARWLLM